MDFLMPSSWYTAPQVALSDSCVFYTIEHFEFLLKACSLQASHLSPPHLQHSLPQHPSHSNNNQKTEPEHMMPLNPAAEILTIGLLRLLDIRGVSSCQLTVLVLSGIRHWEDLVPCFLEVKLLLPTDAFCTFFSLLF